MVCKKDRTGEKNYNNFGSLMIISKYISSKNIDIYFPDYNWTFNNANYSNFIKGNIICPYERRIYDVGYMGEGNHCIYINGFRNIIYDVWHDMLRRCYDDKSILYNPTYGDCYVCDEWLNFQNFADWYELNYYDCDETLHLDKDILFKGNKIYSPETCVFVPARINSLFTKRQNDRGALPIGLSYYGSKNKIRVRCQDKECLNINIGVFDNITDAFQAYKDFKENVIKEVADEYQSIIPNILYEAMYRYEVEIID
jgi:hypothetical protein